MNNKRQVRAGVGIQALALLKNARYTPATALAEYVDNSIQSYLNDRKFLKKINPKCKLKIEIIKNKSELIIKDTAGGICDKDYDRAFELADPPVDTSKLNEFGFGMKGASYWWTDKWSVSTKSYKESYGKKASFDFKKILKTRLEFADVDIKPLNNKKSFTIITLDKIDKPITERVKINLIELLSSSYRYFINLDEIDIYYIDKELNTSDHLRYKQPPVKIIENIEELKDNYANKIQGKPFRKKLKKITWKKNIEFKFNKNKYSVKGEVGVLEKMRAPQSGFFYFRRGRLIERDRPKSIYTYGTGSAQYRSLYGIFKFEGVPTVIDKSALAWNDTEKEDFEHKVLKEIRKREMPILMMSNVPGTEIDEERIKLLGSKKKEERDPINNDVIRFATQALKTLDKATKQGKSFAKISIDDIDTSKSEPMISKTKMGGITYRCKHIRNFSKKNVNPWLTYYPGKKEGKIINFAISICIYHPLINDYMPSTRGIVALELLAAYIVISEIYSKDIAKSNKASDIKKNLNLILDDLPPQGIFEL